MLAAVLFSGCVLGFDSCSSNSKTECPGETEDTTPIAQDTYLAAVDRYLVDSIGSRYTQGNVCIPCATVVGTDESSPDSVLVWGDFWVYNFTIAGDTLRTVSGGSHPGMMLVLRGDDGNYAVASFDQVVDGSGNLESAKRIFGDKYDAFHAVNSDQEKREEARKRFIADYVKANSLPVKCYQDYGWPVVQLPVED